MEEEHDKSWRDFLKEIEVESSDDDSSSGEESDEALLCQQDLDSRHKSDLHTLLSVTQRTSSSRRVGRQPSFAVAKSDETDEYIEEVPASARELKREQRASTQAEASTYEDSPAKSSKPKSLISRLGFFRSSNGPPSEKVGEGHATRLLDMDVTGLTDAWFRRWSTRLGEDGLPCTKVATNGKPYERKVHVDSRNLMIEVRQGRSGTTGIDLDDLVDLRKDLESAEFKKFRQRQTIDDADLCRRALVLYTPTRSFSFLFANASQRDVLSQFIVYLLKAKRRGVMATSSAGGAVSSTASAGPSGTAAVDSGRSEVKLGEVKQTAPHAPMDGDGKMEYPNNSLYEGQFRNGKRHGQGTLTVSDGTRYVCEWQNDERHGRGEESWEDGTIFKGLYVKGMRHGQGMMTWPEGSRYNGMFERNRANGDGELIRTDGSIYRGQFREDSMAGDGCMRWKDGVEYKGQFVANRRDGLGKMVWSSGKWQSYEGSWKDGVQHGRGILIDQSGEAFAGRFIHGKLDSWLSS